jgi:hypothetical protein
MISIPISTSAMQYVHNMRMCIVDRGGGRYDLGLARSRTNKFLVMMRQSPPLPTTLHHHRRQQHTFERVDCLRAQRDLVRLSLQSISIIFILQAALPSFITTAASTTTAGSVSNDDAKTTARTHLLHHIADAAQPPQSLHKSFTKGHKPSTREQQGTSLLLTTPLVRFSLKTTN